MRGRRRLAAVGIAAASIVVGTATTVGYGLATGFDRAAREADLPDVVAHFDRERRPTLDARVRALPNLESRSYRREITGIRLRDAHGHFLRRGTVHIVLGGRRGYAITDGRRPLPAARRGGDRARPGAGMGACGRAIRSGSRASATCAWPASRCPPTTSRSRSRSTARVYVGEQEVRDAFDFREEIRPDIALLWLHDPARADITLAQARVTSFGIGSLSFITREGIRVLLSEAAGIVISLLVAFSLVALLAAGTMLASGAHADVQRRLGAIGVQRALGFTPARSPRVRRGRRRSSRSRRARPGIAIGALVVRGPSASLLAALNEQPPGAALALPLLAGLAAVVALVTAAATWPAWRAARRSPAAILRGGDLARPRAARGARPGRADRARGRLLARAARTLAGLRADHRGQRRGGAADARARLAARARCATTRAPWASATS